MPLQESDLYNDRLWRNALTRNELVYAMAQTRTPPMEEAGPWGSVVQRRVYQPDSTLESSGTGVPDFEWGELGPVVRGGFEVGLSLAWLAERKKGNDFNYDKGSKICNNPPWEATQLQSLYMQLSCENVARWREHWYQGGVGVRHAANHVGLRLDAQGYRASRKVNFADIFENAPEFGLPSLSTSKEILPKGLMLITLLRRFMSHCVAIDHTDNGIRFFDPNLGQFMFKDQERFFSWTLEYCSNTSFTVYDLTQVYYVE